MAPHGKQMTPEEKQIIVVLSQQGYSSYKIAEMTGKNREQSVNFSGVEGCEDRKKTYREVEGVEKREFGETGLCTVCFVRTEDKV
jgi:hypothetical protein